MFNAHCEKKLLSLCFSSLPSQASHHSTTKTKQKLFSILFPDASPQQYCCRVNSQTVQHIDNDKKDPVSGFRPYFIYFFLTERNSCFTKRNTLRIWLVGFAVFPSKKFRSFPFLQVNLSFISVSLPTLPPAVCIDFASEECVEVFPLLVPCRLSSRQLLHCSSLPLSYFLPFSSALLPFVRFSPAFQCQPCLKTYRRSEMDGWYWASVDHQSETMPQKKITRPSVSTARSWSFPSSISEFYQSPWTSCTFGLISLYVKAHIPSLPRLL